MYSSQRKYQKKNTKKLFKRVDMKRNRYTLVEAAILGIFDALKGPRIVSLAMGMTTRHASKAIISKLPRSSGSPWLTVRAYKELTKPAYVQSMEQTMPPEWGGHQVCERIVVYHDAYKAGPHIEQYIVINGKAYNIGVKRLQPQHLEHVNTNNGGGLTLKSREYLIGLLRKEFQNGAWLAQTTDHTPEEARTSWSNHKYSDGYGAGEMREVLLDSHVDVYKTGNTIEYRDWDLNPHKNAYVFGLMEPKTGVRNARILKLGFKEHNDPKFFDRLHLKPHIGTKEFARFKKMVGEDGIVTLKEDGASFYFEVTTKGTKIYSPRISKQTGHRLNYDAKVRDVIGIASEEARCNVTGMGELNYIDTRTGRTLTAHETSGILNTDAPLPQHIEPKLTIYRIDRIGRKDVHNEPYDTNLTRIRDFVRACPHRSLRSPTVLDWNKAEEVAKYHEGLVGIPKNASILDGRKYKPRHDLYDWTVESVELQPGSKGGIAGVIWFKGEKGQRFKIGASSLGSREEAQAIMKNPKKYIGRVAKVSSYKGHEGRAPKLEDWHDAKGFA